VTVYVPSLKEIDKEQDLLNDSIYRGYRPVLLQFVQQLQQARTDQQLMDLQLALLGQVKAHQQLIGDLRADVKALRLQREQAVARQPKDINELRQIEEGIKLKQHQERVQDALRWLLFSVGDGIAWRRTGYDRAAITVLGQGQRVAWLSDGSGWSAEMGALQHQWKNGNFSLLCDITTCLRHGDLLTFEPNQVVLYEVKAGRQAGQESPQMKRLAQATELINTGQTTIDGTVRKIVRSHRPFRTFVDVLGPLLREARAKGEAWRHPSPQQFVVAHDMRHFIKGGDRIPMHIDDRIAQTSRFPDGDITLGHGSAIRRMRDRAHSFATLAPLTIFPLGAEDICDLLLGNLVFSTVINVSGVARRLESAGYQATPFGPPESGDKFMTLKRVIGNKQLTFTIAPHFREMAMLELMTPATVRSAADTLADFMVHERDQQAQHMVVLANEARVWDRRTY
jgi:hypothetical protein